MTKRSAAQKAQSAADELGRISNADTGAVARAFRRSVERLPSGAWLAAGSNFVSDAQGQLSKDRAGILSTDIDNFADYSAVSSFLHSVDSWNYLGQSLDSLARGLTGEAIHLAYYSQLRAAMSLLAGHGIVIGNGTQYVLLQSGKVELLGSRSTHDAAWHLLSKWSSTQAGSDSVGATVAFGGSNLTSWIAACANSGVTNSIVASLTQLWGMDLQSYHADRSRRNLASYTPGGLDPRSPAAAPEWIQETILDVSRLLEPGAHSSFPLLDARLVSGAIAASYDATAEPLSPSVFEKVVVSVGNLSHVSHEVAVQLDEMRLDIASIINAAADTSVSSQPAGSAEEVTRGVIGRSLIMSRLAAGGVVALQNRAGVSPSSMRNWADPFGERLGYWDVADSPDSMQDMWEDVQLDIEAIESIGDIGPFSLRALHEKASSALWRLTRLGRTPIWTFSG